MNMSVGNATLAPQTFLPEPPPPPPPRPTVASPAEPPPNDDRPIAAAPAPTFPPAQLPPSQGFQITLDGGGYLGPNGGSQNMAVGVVMTRLDSEQRFDGSVVDGKLQGGLVGGYQAYDTARGQLSHRLSFGLQGSASYGGSMGGVSVEGRVTGIAENTTLVVRLGEKTDTLPLLRTGGAAHVSGVYRTSLTNHGRLLELRLGVESDALLLSGKQGIPMRGWQQSNASLGLGTTPVSAVTVSAEGVAGARTQPRPSIADTQGFVGVRGGVTVKPTPDLTFTGNVSYTTRTPEFSDEFGPIGTGSLPMNGGLAATVQVHADIGNVALASRETPAAKPTGF